jgi:predicted negative regulator of RcsB-dependent stress response
MMKAFVNKLPLFTLLFILYTILVPAQNDADKLVNIISMKSKQEKINALHKFQNDHPQSPYNGRASQELINTFLDLNEVDSALFQADKFIQTLPAERKGEIYNDIAYMLAEKDAGLDTALAYSNRAVDLVHNNPRYLSMYQDTKAYVLYRKGDSKAAVEIQKEAVKGHEDDPVYLYHLALFSEGAGNLKDALKYSAQAVLQGDAGTSLVKFNEWANNMNHSLKDSIVMDIVHNFIDKMKGVDEKTVRSNAAAFLAETGVNLKLANEWAKDAVNSINDGTLVEDYINYKKNSAIVKTADGKYNEALKDLVKVKDLAAPWSSDYWLTLGKVYEKLNKRQNALDAYITGLAASDNPMLIESAKKLSSENEIQKKVEKMKDKLSSVKEGKYKSSGNKNGKVVLAELFTGAECNPCIAADRAFDELSEYFPRTDLAILEYHLHIPGPDPLTNPDTFKRYIWYGGNFGTPTVFFEGKEKITGGGPKFITANRFNVYDYIIKKYLDEKPGIQIAGDARLNNDKIDINISLKSNKTKTANPNPMLHIALAEKSVKYIGANGINKHIFVVRDLIDGQSGTKLSSLNETISREVNIHELKEKINSYLTNPTTDASWKAPSFHGWRMGINELNKIDTKKLVLVVWVQDDNTKEVLQAHYMDLN